MEPTVVKTSQERTNTLLNKWKLRM